MTKICQIRSFPQCWHGLFFSPQVFLDPLEHEFYPRNTGELPRNAIGLVLAVIGRVFNSSWADFLFRKPGNPDLIDCWCLNIFKLLY